MTEPATHDLDRSALRSRFTKAVVASETPESLGRALYRYVLTEGVAKGELSSDGKSITVPITIKVDVPAPPSPTERKGVSKLCITAFGFEIICAMSSLESTN